MYTVPHHALQRTRQVGWQFFHRFGIHCATHRIRVILISCVVITSLFYPALAIYSSSQPQFLARYSSRILDSVLAPQALVGHRALHDLRDVWADHGALRAREDAVSRARCVFGPTLRAERVLVHGGAQALAGALDKEVLRAALRLRRQLADASRAAGVSCLTRPDGDCLTLDPFAFWSADETVLMDPDPATTLSALRNTSVLGMPLTPEMVLAGRELDEKDDSRIDYATFLAFTYFFHENDCFGNDGHEHWLQLLANTVDHSMDLIIEPQSPRLVGLQYDPHSANIGGHSIISIVLYAAYTIFFVWFSGSMKRFHTVHSRIGLTLTGLVEIIVSTITSLSVCALAGFKITMVPWELFPIVIVFVGAESMFSLVDAVVRTPITLPVKERIATGLSRAGTSNTLKVVSYNSILGIIAAFSHGAIRQFCAFAIVVLVAHWFLVHTFFVAVLSIDIQRLELEELLRQDTSSLTASPPILTTPMPAEPKTAWTKSVSALKNTWKGRASRNLSLVLLLAITGTLHHATKPASVSSRMSMDPKEALTPGALARARSAAAAVASGITTAADHNGPAWQIWTLLNPTHAPLVHVRLESPAVLALRAPGAAAASPPPRVHRPRAALPRALNIAKVVVAPITATTLVLYALLLYLLKDTELLEAQRNRPGPAADDEKLAGERDAAVQNAGFSALPRAFAADIERVAASRDARIVAAAGVHGEVALWRRGRGAAELLDVRAAIGAGTDPAPVVTALAVDADGKLCAAGTDSGAVALWAIAQGMAHPLPCIPGPPSRVAVADVHLEVVTKPGVESAARNGSRPTLPQATVTFTCVVAYQSGEVVRISLEPPRKMVQITPSSLAVSCKTALLRPAGLVHVLAAFYTADGAMELRPCSANTDLVGVNFRVQAGTSSDPVVQSHACCTKVAEVDRLIIATLTSRGRVALWDGATGDCIANVSDELDASVGMLRLTPATRKACAHCGVPTADLFSLTISVGTIFVTYRAHDTLQPRQCQCQPSRFTRGTPPWDGLLNLRSRSGNGTGGRTPRVRSRANSMSAPDAPAFPVSGHGYHSRRASDKEKDIIRIRSDGLVPLWDADDPRLSPTAAPSAPWHGLTLALAGGGAFERGAWDALDTRLVGLRRRPRETRDARARPVSLAPDAPGTGGLSSATLDRWELWVHEPAADSRQASALAALVDEDGRATKSMQQEDTPRLPFTRVSAFVCGQTFCVAGLGNTVGVVTLGSCSPTD